MIIITYWHDEDKDTINSLLCKTEKEAEKIREILEYFGMDVLCVDKITMSTPKEIEDMMKDAYGD